MENAELLSKLRELMLAKNPPPEGWFTADQWAEKWGMSPRTARGYLSNGVKGGLLEKQFFRPAESRQALPHFRERVCGGSADTRGCERTSGTSR